MCEVILVPQPGSEPRSPRFDTHRQDSRCAQPLRLPEGRGTWVRRVSSATALNVQSHPDERPSACARAGHRRSDVPSENSPAPIRRSIRGSTIGPRLIDLDLTVSLDLCPVPRCAFVHSGTGTSACRRTLCGRDRRLPLFVKLSPHLPELTSIAHLIRAPGVDGIIAANTSQSRSDLEGFRFVEEEEGLRGARRCVRFPDGRSQRWRGWSAEYADHVRGGGWPSRLTQIWCRSIRDWCIRTETDHRTDWAPHQLRPGVCSASLPGGRQGGASGDEPRCAGSQLSATLRTMAVLA
jgi:hypothetical protein